MKKNIIYVIFIFIFSLVVLTWFKGNNFVYSGDFKPIFRPWAEFINDFFLWDRFGSGGVGLPSRSEVEIFPYELFIAFGSAVGISTVSLEKIYFYLTMLISGLSMFVLTYFCFENQKNNGLIALLSASFYMFNTYTLFFKWPNQVQSLFAYIFSPLILLFYIKGLEKSRGLFYSFAIAVATLFIAPSVTTPTYPLIIFILLFLYYIFYNLSYRNINSFKRSTLFSLKSAILTILFNWWYIFPYINYISHGYKDIFQYTLSIDSFEQTFRINSTDTSFFNIFRVMGFWAIKGEWQGNSYYPGISEAYLSFPFIIISLFIPIIIFSTFLFKKIDIKTKGFLLFFSLISLGSLFLIKGVHEPFSGINKWLFFNIPGFTLFRSQYEKFGTILVLGYAVLFGWAVVYIYSRLEDEGKHIISKTFVIIVFILIIIINNFPFWTGDIILGQRGILKSMRVKVPDSYYNAGEWLQSALREGRLILFPLSRIAYTWASGLTNHKWGYSSDFMLSRLLNSPVLITIPPYILGSIPDADSLDLLLKIFPLYNIQHFFSDESRDKDSYSLKSLEKINQALSVDNIQKVKEFDQLKFYKINNMYFLPHFYTPQSIVVSNQKVDSLPQIVSQPDYKIRSAIFFEEQNKNKSESLKVIKSIKPEITDNKPIMEFKKINPTKYRAIIHGAKGTFPLVFSESFHEGWKVYLTSLNTSSKYKVQSTKLNDYKILDGNEEDQASKEELQDFIEKGWITTLGDMGNKEIKHLKYENGKEKPDYVEKYKIDFVSKNFQDTIQNDNLSNGSIWETWFSQDSPGRSRFATPSRWPKGLLEGGLGINRNVLQIPDDNHLMVNGYANSWIIDPNEICKDKNICRKNADGSYDMELVVEFWPQRLFYVGLFISGMTLLGCIIYLVYDIINRRKLQITSIKSQF